MTTRTAQVAHTAVGLAQMGAIIPTVDAHPFIPTWAQFLIQLGLMFGQWALAKNNSETDPMGNKQVTRPPMQ